MADACIGKKVSLISKKNRQYFGILSEVNREDKTLLLTDVYRQEDPEMIYENVTFQAERISSITLVEEEDILDDFDDDDAVVAAARKSNDKPNQNRRQQNNSNHRQPKKKPVPVARPPHKRRVPQVPKISAPTFEAPPIINRPKKNINRGAKNQDIEMSKVDMNSEKLNVSSLDREELRKEAEKRARKKGEEYVAPTLVYEKVNFFDTLELDKKHGTKNAYRNRNLRRNTEDESVDDNDFWSNVR
ncbi:hypothetical protein PCE1_001542 [Barthelona sp. PCE]